MGANPLSGSVFETLANYNPAATYARTQAMQAEAAEARARAAALPAQAQADIQMRQQQAQQLQLQNQAIQLQNQYADKVRDVYSSIDMSQPNAFQQFQAGLRNANVPGQVYLAASNDFMDRAKNYAAMNETQRKGEEWKQDQIAGLYSAAINAPQENKQAVWQDAAPKLQAWGQNVPDQYPGDDWAKSHVDLQNQHGKLMGQIKENQTAAAEQQKNQATLQTQAAKELQGMADANGNVKPDDYAALQAKYPQAQLPATNDPQLVTNYIKGNVPAEERLKFAQADTTNLTPDAIQQRVHAALNVDAIKDPDMKARAIAEEQSTVSRAINARGLGPEAVQKEIDQGANNIANAQTSVTTAKVKAPIQISVAAGGEKAKAEAIAETAGPEGLDRMAEQMLNGQFSSRNPMLMAMVGKRAAELAKERGMTNQQALMEQYAAQANRTALTSVTKQYETLKPFADMAEKNAGILEKQIQNVSDLGIPFLNTPLRNVEQQFAGNTKVTAFKAALQPVQADFARILNSPTGGGVLSDDARHEMQAAISPGATPAQIKSALDIFRQDAQNRKAAYEANIADLQGKTTVGNAGVNKPSANPTPKQETAAVGAPAAGTTRTYQGKTYKFKGGDWKNKDNWEVQ